MRRCTLATSLHVAAGYQRTLQCSQCQLSITLQRDRTYKLDSITAVGLHMDKMETILVASCRQQAFSLPELLFELGTKPTVVTPPSRNCPVEDAALFFQNWLSRILTIIHQDVSFISRKNLVVVLFCFLSELCFGISTIFIKLYCILIQSYKSFSSWAHNRTTLNLLSRHPSADSSLIWTVPSLTLLQLLSNIGTREYSTATLSFATRDAVC